MDFSQWKLYLRRGFGILVLLGLLPTSFVLREWGLSMAETRPGAFLLQYAWLVTVVMAIAVGAWVEGRCRDIKEGYWMYYFSIIVSVIACNNLGPVWKLFSSVMLWVVVIGLLVYILLDYIEVGPSDRFSITTEEFGRRYVLSTTVLMTPALAYSIGYLVPTWWGCVLAVAVPVVLTLVVVAVWRGYRAPEALVLLAVGFFLELVALAFVVHFAFPLFILGFALFLSAFYEKKETTESEDNKEVTE